MIFVEVAVHLLNTALHNVCNLVAVRRVVDLERRVGACQDGRVAIHMLQTLTGERGAPCGCADHEAAYHLVSSSPEGVAGALEPKHRVEDVDRDHRLTVGVEGRTNSGERCGCARLVNTHVKDLTLRRLCVGEHELVIHRHIVLAVGVVQLSGGEERVHTEGACLVRGDGYDAVAEAFHTHQVLHQAHERHGGGGFLLTGALLSTGVCFIIRQGDFGLSVRAVRNVPAQLLTALVHVLQGRVVCRRHIVRRVVEVLLQLLIRDGDVQVVTEAFEGFHGELLNLVG